MKLNWIIIANNIKSDLYIYIWPNLIHGANFINWVFKNNFLNLLLIRFNPKLLQWSLSSKKLFFDSKLFCWWILFSNLTKTSIPEFKIITRNRFSIKIEHYYLKFKMRNNNIIETNFTILLDSFKINHRNFI